jgi:hypothetical protein
MIFKDEISSKQKNAENNKYEMCRNGMKRDSRSGQMSAVERTMGV